MTFNFHLKNKTAGINAHFVGSEWRRTAHKPLNEKVCVFFLKVRENHRINRNFISR